jgi:serine/threonine-protein kinase
VGQTLGEFRVAEKVTASGLVVCYRALQPSLNRNVLLQVYPPAVSKDDAFRERLLAEVRAVSPLLHPNILQLFDLEEEGGWLFLVLEYFKGSSLADHLSRSSFLPIRGAIDLAVQLCDALVYAGEQQWVVTEVSASNVLIDDKFTAKLRLFRDPADTDDAPVDKAEMACLAPEVLSPARSADVRSAVYSLGALLFRCVGGMPPFAAPDMDALKARILKDPPRNLKKLNIRASDGLCEVVGRALEKNPDKRFQSPAELAVELKKLVSGSGR